MIVIYVASLGCNSDPAAPDCEQTLAPVAGAVGGSDVFDAYDPSGCMPDRRAWSDVVAPVVEAKCGGCHGSAPAFGAPLSLDNYDTLVAGEAGNRIVDRMAHRAANHTMPPPASPPLAHQELDLLVEWSTCGEVHPDPTVGLVVNREPYGADVPDNLALPHFDVLGNEFEVTRETLNAFQCFAIDAPIDEPRFLRRLQVVLDEARVLHHVVLMRDPLRTSEGQRSFECEDWEGDGAELVWAWAPGTNAFDFDEGGLELVEGERLVVQIHYNNGAGLDGVRDSSGVRIYHGPAQGVVWSLIDPGPAEFVVPEGDSATCGTLAVGRPARVLAGLPHMHELGVEFESAVVRENGQIDDLVKLTGWNFEAQLFYRLDVEIRPGDTLHTRCGYRNETGRDVVSGLATEDEMCSHFLYIAPQ